MDGSGLVSLLAEHEAVIGAHVLNHSGECDHRLLGHRTTPQHVLACLQLHQPEAVEPQHAVNRVAAEGTAKSPLDLRGDAQGTEQIGVVSLIRPPVDDGTLPRAVNAFDDAVRTICEVAMVSQANHCLSASPNVSATCSPRAEAGSAGPARSLEPKTPASQNDRP